MFNGYFEVYLSNNETIVVYFDSSVPVEGHGKIIKLKQIINLNQFKENKSEGFYIRDVDIRDIKGNKKLESWVI